MVVERRDAGGEQGLILGFPAGRTQTVLVIDGFRQSVSGLEMLDGKSADANASTYKGRLLAPNKRSTVRLEVRKGGITVRCDVRTVIDWKGDLARLSMSRNWSVRDPKVLFVGSQASFLIHKLTFS